jgi:chromosome segregation ATPase
VFEDAPAFDQPAPDHPSKPPADRAADSDRFGEDEIVAEVLPGEAERFAGNDSHDLNGVEADIVEARAKWENAFNESRAELEAALAEERAALQATLAEEQARRQRALGELAQAQELAASRAAEVETLARQIEQLRTLAVRPDPPVDTAGSEAAELEARLAGVQTILENERRQREAADEELARSRASSRTVELDTLAQQIDNLRGQVERSAGAVVAEQQVRGEMHRLEARVTALESALTQERTAHRDALEELDYARTEAKAQANELRSSLDRIRTELARLDAATTWFEYWSGAATLTISS